MNMKNSVAKGAIATVLGLAALGAGAGAGIASGMSPVNGAMLF
jgi:hypothetical protein